MGISSFEHEVIINPVTTNVESRTFFSIIIIVYLDWIRIILQIYSTVLQFQNFV
jgi:hypothetical protein